MDKNYEEQKEKDYKRVKMSRDFGIVDNITTRKYEYPENFYLILEALDLVLRVHVGNEQMGTSGVQELATLMAIFDADPMLYTQMPTEGKAFFKCLLNPVNKWKICEEACLGFGSIYRAYAVVREYLIDNKERVAEVYNKLPSFMNEMNEKYAKKLERSN